MEKIGQQSYTTFGNPFKSSSYCTTFILNETHMIVKSYHIRYIWNEYIFYIYFKKATNLQKVPTNITKGTNVGKIGDYCNGYGFLVRVLSYRTLRFDSGESMCTRNSLRGIYFLMNFYLVQNS